jgi:hypothetical protein
LVMFNQLMITTTGMSYGLRESILIGEATTHLLFITKSKYSSNFRLYIYGGHDISNGTLSSLWMTDMGQFSDLEIDDVSQEQSCNWEMIDTTGKETPGSITHHSSVVYNDKMFLFGGSGQFGENQHLWNLDLKTFKWDIINAVSYVLNFREVIFRSLATNTQLSYMKVLKLSLEDMLMVCM